MVMQLNQPIKAGEQVFLDYGKISAQNWLINYGMIDPALVKEPGNIQVWVPKELSVSSNKMKLLQHFPLLKGFVTERVKTVSVNSKEAPVELLWHQRLINAGESDEPFIKEMAFHNGSCSLLTEFSAIRSSLLFLKTLLDSIPSSYEEDLWKLHSDGLVRGSSTRLDLLERTIIQARIIERIVLQTNIGQMRLLWNVILKNGRPPHPKSVRSASLTTEESLIFLELDALPAEMFQRQNIVKIEARIPEKPLGSESPLVTADVVVVPNNGWTTELFHSSKSKEIDDRKRVEDIISEAYARISSQEIQQQQQQQQQQQLATESAEIHCHGSFCESRESSLKDDSKVDFSCDPSLPHHIDEENIEARLDHKIQKNMPKYDDHEYWKLFSSWMRVDENDEIIDKNFLPKMKKHLNDERDLKIPLDLAIIAPPPPPPVDGSAKEGMKPRVCLLVPTLSPSNISTASQLPLIKNLLRSFLNTITRQEFRRFEWKVYIGHNSGDFIFDVPENYGPLSKSLKAITQQVPMVQFHVLRFLDIKYKGNPVAIWSQLAIEGFLRGGCHFFFQVNDDIEFQEEGWTSGLTSQLMSNKVPGLGVVGPVDVHQPRIFTQAMVTRNHLHLFQTLFPVYFRNWYSDDWINLAYPHPSLSRTIKEFHIVNSVRATPRYSVDLQSFLALNPALVESCQRLEQYLRKNGLWEQVIQPDDQVQLLNCSFMDILPPEYMAEEQLDEDGQRVMAPVTLQPPLMVRETAPLVNQAYVEHLKKMQGYLEWSQESRTMQKTLQRRELLRDAVNQLRQKSKQMNDRERRRQGLCNTIILATSNFGYLDLALNWLSLMNKLQLDNILLVATDVATFTFLQELKSSKAEFSQLQVVFHQSVATASEAQLYLKDSYRDVVNVKPQLILDLLLLGVDVLLSDTDIVWLHDALDFLPVSDYDVIFQNDAKPGGNWIANTGFIWIRSSPLTIRLYRDVVRQTKISSLQDQRAFNAVINGRSYVKDLRLKVLPAEMFPNGWVWFSAALPQSHRVVPHIIHMNWLTGHDSKRFRMREAKVWVIDGPEYFDLSNMNSKGYLTYSNLRQPKTIEAAMSSEILLEQQVQELQLALSLARLLQRTLILPQFWVTGHITKVLDPTALPFVTAETLFEIERFADLGVEIREHSFLSHPQLLRLNPSPVHSCVALLIDCSASEGEIQLQNARLRRPEDFIEDMTHMRFSHSHILKISPSETSFGRKSSLLTANDLLSWLGSKSQQTVASAPLLVFGPLLERLDVSSFPFANDWQWIDTLKFATTLRPAPNQFALVSSNSDR